MFVGEMRSSTNQGVATIGGKGHQPSGIGTVRWTWRDDIGKLHEFLIEDVLFFPQSPNNILSVTYLARQLKDLAGTGIDTKQLQSRFYWDLNKYSLTIHHLPSNLPEISINQDFALSTMFRALVSRVINPTNHSKYGCCYTHMHDDANESPTIQDPDRRSVCCGHQSDFTSVKVEITEELFDIGETFFFTNNSWSNMVKVNFFP